mmetsp:Transcript_72126/g.120072  ORF Transcript_72126/g.120072 Transcript_72126/m.120072 type:complete len:338 (+) Transcript_72126:33-1046(+)
MASALRILALGPNPALQRVLTFEDELHLGGVNRASAVSRYVGGKGQGVAFALNRWAPLSVSVAQFVGGDTGVFVENELARQGIECISQHTEAHTRICTTLIGKSTEGKSTEGLCTELIDPSGTVREEECQCLLAHLEQRLALKADFGGIALCGTTPPGAAALYERLCEKIMGLPQILLLDGFKGIEGVLNSGRLDVLKINVDEVKALTGAAGPREAAHLLLHAKNAPLCRPGSLLALTDGAGAALLFSKSGRSWQISVPRIRCVNAIGAGDVCTGVFLHSLVIARATAKGMEEDAAEAFAWGIAAACARCTREQPNFEREEVEKMRACISISEISAA